MFLLRSLASRAAPPRCPVAASVGQVVDQGLTPAMAILACNNLQIKSCVLSREIGQAVTKRAESEVAAIRQKQKDGIGAIVLPSDGAPAVSSAEVSSDRPDGTAKKRRRSRTSSSAPQTEDSPPLPAPAKPDLNSLSIMTMRFSAPYLKGQPTHFQRKVRSKVEQLLEKQPLPDPPVEKSVEVIVTRQTSHQRNVQWQNEKSYDEDRKRRYKSAMKEATQIFADLRDRKIKNPLKQPEYIAKLNEKYSLDGAGREGSREKHMLALSTVRNAVSDGKVGCSPLKKGPSAKISREFLELVALHTNMEQVCERGEMDAAAIKGTMIAAIMDTPHEKKFNYDYAWEECRRLNADIMVPVSAKETEDIRWQWVTFENMRDFYDILGVSMSDIYFVHLNYVPSI